MKTILKYQCYKCSGDNQWICIGYYAQIGAFGKLEPMTYSDKETFKWLLAWILKSKYIMF